MNGDTYIRDRLKFVSPPTRREPTPSRRSYPLYENVCRFWKVRRHCRRRNLGQEERGKRRRSQESFLLVTNTAVRRLVCCRIEPPRPFSRPSIRNPSNIPPLRHPRRCFCALSRLAAFNECNTISSSRQRIRNQLNGFIRFPVHCAWKVRVEERKEKRRGES